MRQYTYILKNQGKKIIVNANDVLHSTDVLFAHLGIVLLGGSKTESDGPAGFVAEMEATEDEVDAY